MPDDQYIASRAVMAMNMAVNALSHQYRVYSMLFLAVLTYICKGRESISCSFFALSATTTTVGCIWECKDMLLQRQISHLYTCGYKLSQLRGTCYALRIVFTFCTLRLDLAGLRFPKT